MVSPVDLAKYTESDEDEDQVLIKKPSKRSEWAKGKSRAQPSENWDDDFLFGSASTSTDSLSISSPVSPTPTEPPSSKSTTKERSIKTHPPLPPDVLPTSVVRYQDSNATTPRKKSQSSKASVSPSLQSPTLLTSPSRPNNPRTSTNTTPKALSVRPPSSAPASRAGLTHPTPLVLPSTMQPLRHGSDPDSGSQARQPQRKPTLAGRTAQHSRPPISLRRRPSSHQAVSSQDSVPSISDLSSAGIRSPSSSHSTTDERSRSSDDYSAGFGRNSGRGNRSFNTETEFTEPETELDWGEDTDLDNRSSCSPVNLAEQQRSERLLLAGSHPRPPALKLKGSVRSVRAVDSSRSSRGILASRPSRSSLASPSDSSLTTKFMTTGPSPLLEPSSASYQRSAHSSFDSQTTFTSVQSSKSKTATVGQHVPAASSSKSSIAYKSDHSDISLNSTSSRLIYENEVLNPTLSTTYETQSHRRSQNRNPSMSSSSSSRAPPLAYHASSSDFDALTSGTETDGSGYPLPGQLTSRNGSQRSRKQALYSRPSYARPSTPVLAISSSSSTLNTSSRSPSGRVTDEGEADISLCGQIVEEDGRLKNLRRRLRKKRPSALPLSPVPVPSSSTTVLRKPSVAESIYSDTQLSGDLAFAADSEDEGRGQTRRSTRNATVAKPPSSPFEMIEKSDVLSINLRSPTPVAPGSGPNIRTRSSVSSYGSSQPSQISATKAGSTESKKLKTRRPLSFTALLSRNSVGSLSPGQTSKATGKIKPAEPSPSPVSGLFIRKSTETVREPLETLATTGAAPTAPSTSYVRGHFRQAASIGSNPEPSGESFLSRVRRLSSRKSTPPGTPNRKRFSIIHGSSSSRLSTSPSSSTNALSASVSSTPSAHRRTNRSPTLVQTGPGGTGTVKGRRPSTRESSDRPTGLSNRSTSLRRRFSASSNNKAAADQPNLTLSPPAAPHLISNHNNTSQRSLGDPSSGSAASFASTRRSIANSKPPKSNPGLRRKAAASVSATLEAYSLNSPPPPSEVDVPTSEPLPDPSTTTIPAPPVVIGRSNSMGELRIPSRITSQQGRLQNELNQMKEFARGIDDLKSMRSHYRSLIESTAAATTSKIKVRGNKEGDEDEFGKEETDYSDGESVQPSPTALARLSETIAKIEANYREWWTCCNVLIDLGDGERDPRTRFSPERVRAFSCDPNNKSSTASTSINTTSPIDQQNKHFEILKSMFGPGASPPRVTDEDQTITIPDDGSVKGKSTTLTNLKERSPQTIRRRPKPRLRRTFAGHGTIGSERDEISETDRSSSCRSVGNSTQVRSTMKVRGRVQGQGRTALQGVKDFLRTLKARMQDDKSMIGSAPELSTAISSVIATSAIGRRSVSSPSYIDHSNSNSTSTTTSESSSSEECWDELFANRTESLDLASTSTNPGGVNGNINGQKKRLALSSDRMPLLLNYLTIVRIQCEACLKELRSQTV